MTEIQTIFCNSKNVNDYLKLLNEESDGFSLDDVRNVCSSVDGIVALLNKSQTRHVGLLILYSYLQQCSIEVIERKGVQWITLVLRSCNSKDMSKMGNLVYLVLKLLITTIHNIQEISKSFINNLLSNVYETLSFITAENTLCALKCFEACLRLHPAPTEPFREKIEKFLLKFIDCHDVPLVRWSGKCLHLLQNVRCSAARNIDSRKNWQTMQIKLLGSMHSVLNSAFEHCTELVDSLNESEQLTDALELSDDPSKRAAQIYLRLRNLNIYMRIMLKDPFPVQKSIAVEKIFNLLSRGLGVTCQILIQKNISENLAISSFLPYIHIHLYELVEALIVVLKSHLAMFQVSIMRFIIETLKWTSIKDPSDLPITYMTLRSKAYNTLTMWCQSMGYGSRCEAYADSILPHIINDICIMQKFAPKLQGEIKKPIGEHFEEEIQKMVAAALKCLNSVLQSAGSMIPTEYVKDIQIKVATICGSFLRIPDKKLNYISYNAQCRLEAYKALQTLVMSPHHLFPPPTETIIHLLQTSLSKDLSFHVRENNARLLSSLEKIVHPQKECLLFPTSYREIKNSFKSMSQEPLFKNHENVLSVDEESTNIEQQYEDTNPEENRTDLSTTLETVTAVGEEINRNNNQNFEIQNSEKIILISDGESEIEVLGRPVKLRNNNPLSDDIHSDESDLQPSKKKRKEDLLQKENELNAQNENEGSFEPEVNNVEDAERYTSNTETKLKRNSDDLIDERDEDLLTQITATFVDELN